MTRSGPKRKWNDPLSIKMGKEKARAEARTSRSESPGRPLHRVGKGLLAQSHTEPTVARCKRYHEMEGEITFSSLKGEILGRLMVTLNVSRLECPRPVDLN